MKTLQINVKYNVHRAFAMGMETGVMRLFDNPRHEAVQCRFILKREIDAFIQGFNLAKADEYFFAWKAGKNLLHMAVRNGDINAVDWHFYNGWVEAE